MHILVDYFHWRNGRLMRTSTMLCSTTYRGFKFFPAYKSWLGQQTEFYCTDRYRKKKHIQWGKPCIWLMNEDPRSQEVDLDWLEKNCIIEYMGNRYTSVLLLHASNRYHWYPSQVVVSSASVGGSNISKTNRSPALPWAAPEAQPTENLCSLPRSSSS